MRTHANWLKVCIHSVIILALTIISQLGGLAWLASRFFRFKLIAFLIIYASFSFAAIWVAPVLGRVPITCSSSETLKMQSWIYCLLNRQYVTAELSEVANDLANHMKQEYPGTITLALDGSFPFFDGFPLLPHLSHDDGKKLDLAFYYQNETGYLLGKTRSPIGYFAFEDGPTNCQENWLTLRWNLIWLQNLWPDLKPEPQRMKTMLQWLAEDNRISKAFLEPHLLQRLYIAQPKFRFQGCRAARHDDHIHIQIE